MLPFRIHYRSSNSTDVDEEEDGDEEEDSEGFV